MKKLSFKQSRHLIERSGIGPELDRIESFVGQPLGKSLSQILSASTQSQVPIPVFTQPSRIRELRKSGKKNRFEKSLKLRGSS